MNLSTNKLINFNLNWILFVFFSALVSSISVGLTYSIELLSKIVIDKQHNLVNKAIIVLVLWVLLSLLIRYLYLYYKKKVIYHWNNRIKNNLMDRILSRTAVDFKHKDRTYYVSLFNNDIKFLEENLLLSIAEIAGQTFLFILALIYSLSINYIITILILLSGVLSVLITNKLSSLASKDNKEYMENLGVYNAIVDDGLRGYPVIYKSNAVREFMKIFHIKTEVVEDKHSKAVFTSGLMNNLINQFSLTVQMILCFVTTLFIVNGKMEVVYFPVMMSLMNLLIYPMYTIMSQYGKIKSCKAISDNLKQELNFEPEIKLEDNKDIDFKYISSIKFVDLKFSYDEKVIFDQVNIEVKDKEHVLLRGGSGSGKSTLLKILIKECIPDSGGIYIGDKEISTMSRTELFNSVSVISQHPMIFRDTILQNIVLFQDEDKIDQNKLIESIRFSGLEYFISNLDSGIHTVLVDSGDNLSGGEKQRIEVARAIYRDTPIVLIDEATSGLDLSKARDLEHIFKKMDKTIISTSHREDIDLSMLYDRTLIIENLKVNDKYETEEITIL